MVYSCDRAVRSLKDPGGMQAPMKEPDFEDLVTDHHSYAASVAGYRRRLSGPGAFDAGTVSGFIDTMGVAGLSPGRQVFYVTRLPRILSAVRATGARSVAALDADGCKAVLARLVSEKYSGETKLAYALCLKKLVHYARTGNLGGAGAAGGYVAEVSWITPSQYRSKSGGVRRQDLLTGDEFVRMVRAGTLGPLAGTCLRPEPPRWAAVRRRQHPAPPCLQMPHTAPEPTSPSATGAASIRSSG